VAYPIEISDESCRGNRFNLAAEHEKRRRSALSLIPSENLAPLPHTKYWRAHSRTGIAFPRLANGWPESGIHKIEIYQVAIARLVSDPLFGSRSDRRILDPPAAEVRVRSRCKATFALTG
jgi:hypothetical protein